MRLREIRNKRKMSGTEVAEFLGISPQYYYDLERGERNLSSELAIKLSELFKTTTDYLLGKTENNLYDLTLSAQQKNPEGPDLDSEEVLELSDKELFDRFTFNLDGEKISDEEAKGIIAFLRASRDIK